LKEEYFPSGGEGREGVPEKGFSKCQHLQEAVGRGVDKRTERWDVEGEAHTGHCRKCGSDSKWETGARSSGGRETR
jgi:hypothetical protein